MKEESRLKRTSSVAGLLTGVGCAWALLLTDGSLSGDWLLAGFLAFGLGVLSLDAIERLGRLISAVGSTPGEEAPAAKVVAASSDEEAAPAPRLRVLLISSGLEALAASLLAVYFIGNLLAALAVGLGLGAVAVMVSVLLSQRLTGPA